MNLSQMEPGKLVIFQPVLQAYPTRNFWIITAHVSLGNLECHWETFQQATCQNTTISQILGSTPISTSTATYYTPARIIQHPGHIQIQQDHYNFCHQPSELQPTTDQNMMQKKPAALSRRCPQLAYRNCHH